MATVAVLAVLLGAGLTVRSTADDLGDAQHLLATAGAARQTTAELRSSYVDEETGLRGFLITGDDFFLEPYDLADAASGEKAQDLRRDLDELGVDPVVLDQLEAAHAEWKRFAAFEFALYEDDPSQARSFATTARGKVLFDEVRTRVRALDRVVERRWTDHNRTTELLQGRLVALLVAVLGLLLTVTVLVGLLLWRGITRPLARLAAATRAVATGDLAARLPVAGVPEVAGLGSDVAAMRDRLTADLHGTHEALAALEHAEPAVGALRRALQPTLDALPGTEVSGRLDAAEGVLAGDWFDVLRLDHERLALVIGDVAGHGPVSAVFALRLKHSLTTALRAVPSPASALGRVSQDLLESPDPSDAAGELFATVFIAIVDTTSGTLRYASAGHPDAFVLSGGREPTDVLDPADLVDPREVLNPREHRGLVGGTGSTAVTWTSLPSSGPLLSPLVAGWSWTEHERPFRTGESLLVYTDGIVEARDAGGFEFGAEGVLNCVGRTGLADGPRLLDAVAAGAVRHVDGLPRRDDQTLVLLRRTRSLTAATPEARTAEPDRAAATPR